MYSNGPPHMARQKQDDQLEHTFSSYVRIRDVVLKTCQRRWTIGRSGESGSGISMLMSRHDDDDDDDIYILSSSKYLKIFTFSLRIYTHSVRANNFDTNCIYIYIYIYMYHHHHHHHHHPQSTWKFLHFMSKYTNIQKGQIILTLTGYVFFIIVLTLMNLYW